MNESKFNYEPRRELWAKLDGREEKHELRWRRRRKKKNIYSGRYKGPPFQIWTHILCHTNVGAPL